MLEEDLQKQSQTYKISIYTVRSQFCVGWVKALRNPTFIPIAYTIKRNALDNHVVLSLRDVVRSITCCSYILSIDQRSLTTNLIQ
jgi:hypothetical protein